MDDNQKWIIGAIIAVLIVYLYIKIQPKYVEPEIVPKPIEELKPRVDVELPRVHQNKSTGYHRSYSRLANTAGIPEKFGGSIDQPIRRTSTPRSVRNRRPPIGLIGFTTVL